MEDKIECNLRQRFGKLLNYIVYVEEEEGIKFLEERMDN